MDGYPIKAVLIIVLIFTLSSCNSDLKNIKTIEEITNEYIIDFRNLEKSTEHNFVLHIKKDSSNLNYDVHRMSMWINAINTSYLPNRIKEKNGITIAFFTERVIDNKKSKEITEILKKNNFFKKDSFSYNSNYPEWVVLKSTKTGKKTIVKDMWYSPLDSIIKRYQEQLN